MLLGEWSLLPSIGVFVAGAVVILWLGPRLARLAEALAIRTGLGQAVAGALFLGMSTSLPGITTSVTAAASGDAELAVSNGIGGIAAQTAFLGVADLVYRRGNLEHDAASPANIFQCGLLICLLALVILAMAGPDRTLLDVHPATVVLPLAYGLGLRMAYRTRESGKWNPAETRFTQTEGDGEQGEDDERSTPRLWRVFALTALGTGLAGWFVARSGISIAEQTGISSTVVGGLFTAVATSTPELVSAIAAVRRGALILAVGDIIGGNAFDVLFVAMADVFYRDGSIYHAVGANEVFLIALGILLTGVLLMGLVRREERGIANIGFESALILGLYVAGFLTLAFLR